MEPLGRQEAGPLDSKDVRKEDSEGATAPPPGLVRQDSKAWGSPSHPPNPSPIHLSPRPCPGPAPLSVSPALPGLHGGLPNLSSASVHHLSSFLKISNGPVLTPGPGGGLTVPLKVSLVQTPPCISISLASDTYFLCLSHDS